MDHTKVKQKFITNKTYISEDIHIFVNMSVWGGPIATWIGSKVSFDTHGQLHGLCQLNLKYEFFNKTGHHDFLEWSLKYISGHFIHGKLQGNVLLITWRGVGIYAVFKDGELHGPIHSIGRKFLFDIEVCNSYKWFLHKKLHHQKYFNIRPPKGFGSLEILQK